MNSKDVTNNSDRTLNIGGVDIAPKKTGRIDNWQKVDRSNAVQAWIAAGIITIKNGSEGLPPLPGMPGVGEDEAEKQKVIDELAKFGIERTTKSGLDSLKKQLAEAKEKAAS